MTLPWVGSCHRSLYALLSPVSCPLYPLAVTPLSTTTPLCCAEEKHPNIAIFRIRSDTARKWRLMGLRLLIIDNRVTCSEWYMKAMIIWIYYSDREVVIQVRKMQLIHALSLDTYTKSQGLDAWHGVD
jgi:hypothetical protein